MRRAWRVGTAVGVIALIVLVAGAAAPLSSAAHKARSATAGVRGNVVGQVYTETNDFNQNKVVAFDRYSDGLIVQSASVSTGGKGVGAAEPGCPSPCPFLDTQGSVNLTDDGHWLFAVNAGSNSISSFKITGGKPKLVGTFPSGGTFPISVATHGNLLYVLNTQSLNIAGFKIAGNGKLTAIAGSNQHLTSDAGFPDASPRQIGFDNTGRVVVVTLLGRNSTPAGPGDINTFVLNGSGAAGPAKANTTAHPLPFAFDFDKRNHLVVAEVNALNGAPGFLTTYSISSSGTLTQIDSQGTHAFAPCWIVVSKDGRYVYTVNTGGGAPPGAGVTAFKLDSSGHLSFLQLTPNNSLGTGTGMGGAPSPDVREYAQTDIGLSKDGRYAYVVSVGIPTPSSHIDMYDVGSNGMLSLFAVTPSTLPGGITGIAVR
jgi:6-phosphogluconolactonase